MAKELTEAQQIEKALKRSLYFSLPIYGSFVGWHARSTHKRIDEAGKALKKLEEIEGPTSHIKDIRAWVNYYQHKADDAAYSVSEANYRA